MKWYFETLRKYAVFAGRARRREYWMFELWHALILVALFVIDIKVSASGHNQSAVLTGLYLLATVLPSFAGLVRRLHDTNHSGWWIFISLVPLVGQFVLLRFLIKDGDPGPNRFGPNPKTEAVAPAPLPEMGYLAPPLPPDRR
jgi:uncharacterized membrane protein YhaH (DUF805 family)